MQEPGTRRRHVTTSRQWNLGRYLLKLHSGFLVMPASVLDQAVTSRNHGENRRWVCQGPKPRIHGLRAPLPLQHPHARARSAGLREFRASSFEWLPCLHYLRSSWQALAKVSQKTRTVSRRNEVLLSAEQSMTGGFVGSSQAAPRSQGRPLRSPQACCLKTYHHRSPRHMSTLPMDIPSSPGNLPSP